MNFWVTQDIQNSWIFQDAEKFKWWVDLLLMADEEGKIHMSLSDLTHRWRQPKTTVHRFLENLKLKPICGTKVERLTEHLMFYGIESYKGARNAYVEQKRNADKERSSSSFSPIPPLSSSPKEIYNSSTAHTCEEDFIRRYREEGDSGMWPNTAVVLHKGIPACKELFERWIVEYRHNGETHRDYTDFKKHFINWARITISKESRQQSNGNNRPDYSRRGRADVPEDISLDF